MSNTNSVVITGRLTRDPELRLLPSGSSVCELSIAVNSREKRNDEWGDRVDFIDVTVWGNQGENCSKYLEKGRQVCVKGRLRQDRWEQDGSNRSKVKIIAEAVEFLSGDKDREKQDGDTSGYREPEADPASSRAEDDIPF